MSALPFSSNIDFIFFILILMIAIGALVLTRRLLRVSFPYFFMGLIGLIIGLLVGTLLAGPLANLPGVFGKWVPVVVQIFVTVALVDLFVAQARSVTIFFQSILSRVSTPPQVRAMLQGPEIIVDTSILIDGRINEVCEAGFLIGRLVVPRFVLTELQQVADSSDAIKRTRGRRGLEVLDHLKNIPNVIVDIVDDSFLSKESTDLRLVQLARAKKGRLLTLDYNLAQIAKLQGVPVMNLHELSQALRPVFIPGEQTDVKIVQKGKEKGQGVGYLPDGTMIVVEGGDKLVGQEIKCEVVRIYQTVAGKIIFVEPLKSKHRRDKST